MIRVFFTLSFLLKLINPAFTLEKKGKIIEFNFRQYMKYPTL